MNVIVDTSIWSLAFRRNAPDETASILKDFRDLIANGEVVLLGAIRQEIRILFGISSNLSDYETLYVLFPI